MESGFHVKNSQKLKLVVYCNIFSDLFIYSLFYLLIYLFMEVMPKSFGKSWQTFSSLQKDRKPLHCILLSLISALWSCFNSVIEQEDPRGPWLLALAGTAPEGLQN